MNDNLLYGCLVNVLIRCCDGIEPATERLFIALAQNATPKSDPDPLDDQKHNGVTWCRHRHHDSWTQVKSA